MSWDLEQFKGKDVVFVGAGKGRALTGIKTFLEQHAPLASFTSVDKAVGPEPLGFLRGYDPATTVFIKNEAIPGNEMPVPYLTPLQLFFFLLPTVNGATSIGITGTKGKSTTAALTAHILSAAGKNVVLAGNIGVSPLLALDTASADSIFVLELSSYQLSDLKVSPHVSACLNLYNDHTDWHGSLPDYWEAKHNIMRFSATDDLFIYNPDFPELRKWADEAQCRTKAIDPNEPLDLSRAMLFGDHNRLNALFARQIAREFGVDDDVAQRAIDSFQPLKHRMELVTIKSGKTYVDDAIGMTPESTMASLRAIDQKFGSVGCLMLGGQDRNYDYHPLMEVIRQQAIPLLILFPDTVEKMKAALPEDYRPQILETRDMRQAVALAAQHAPKQSVVLLSTAAPSYSLWKDFEDKGDQFQTAVQQLE